MTRLGSLPPVASATQGQMDARPYPTVTNAVGGKRACCAPVGYTGANVAR
jgi:hypothetical protein